MPLVFDDRGLLPLGVHEASLEEVEEAFARFQKSDRRLKLFAKLLAYAAALKKAGCGTAIILDGSFVMGCIDEPEDIDLIVILPENWDLKVEIKPCQYNLVSKQRVRKEYGFDIFAVLPGSVEEQDWTTFFGGVNVKWCEQFDWPKKLTKGIVKVKL